MRITEEQDSAFLYKTPVGIMDIAFAGSQADFIKFLSAVDTGCITVFLNLKNVETF
ncbi:hypothetical protein D3C73_1656750 [compost metagenome]